MGFMLLSHKMVTKFGGGGGGGGTIPDATNTGPRLSSTTTISGDYTLTSGSSISRYHITGDLYMGGPNVTATDCQVDGSILFNAAPGGNYGNPNAWANQQAIYCRCGHIDSNGYDTITVDHCHVDGSLAGPGTLVALLKLNQGNALTFTSNLVDNPASVGGGTGFHLEALHLSGSTGALIQGNVFNWNADSATQAQTTTCVNIDNSTNTNVTFDGNYLFGGPLNQIYLFLSGTSFVTNNKFTTPPGTTQFSDVNSSSFHFTQSGNTRDGSPYTLPFG